MTARRTLLVIALTFSIGLACSVLGVSPVARYKITERFPERLGRVEIVGIQVNSALPAGVLSEADLEKLAGFICERLQIFTIGLLANLNAGANAKQMEVILTIEISRFDASTQEQRKNRVPSYLHGDISLHRVSTGKRLGTATIWARGSGLKLKTNNIPDTVEEFALAIRQIYK